MAKEGRFLCQKILTRRPRRERDGDPLRGGGEGNGGARRVRGRDRQRRCPRAPYPGEAAAGLRFQALLLPGSLHLPRPKI